METPSPYLKNERIYFDFDKYIESLGSIDVPNFVYKLQDAKTKVKPGCLVSQSAIFDHLKLAKSPLERMHIVKHYQTLELEAIKVQNNVPHFTDVDELTFVDLFADYPFKFEEVQAVFGKIPSTESENFSVLCDFADSIENANVVNWIVNYSRSNTTFMFEKTHLFEKISAIAQEFYASFFNPTRYPRLSQEELNEKLTLMIGSKNLFMVKFFLGLGAKFSESISFNQIRWRYTLEDYQFFEYLLSQGYFPDESVCKQLPPSHVLYPLYQGKLDEQKKKLRIKNVLDTMGKLNTEGIEAEIVLHFVNKLNKQ